MIKFPYKPVPNAVGFDSDSYRGVKRLIRALSPYKDYTEVAEEIRELEYVYKEMGGAE